MSLALCDLCQQFDIRDLLLLSEKQESTSVKTRLTGNVSADIDYRPGIPDFFSHHATLAALKAAYPSCRFCTAIWELWSKSPQAGSEVDEYLDRAGQGQIYIGTGGCNVTKHENPSITISQRPQNESPRILCNFEVFATDPTPGRECTYVGREVSQNSSSKACETIARGWYQTCTNNHPDCGPVQSSKGTRNPTRVIDVGTDPSSIPFLDIEPKKHQITWVALSYCWGGNSPFVLRNERVEELTGGIELSKFPATLRDAIVITRQLGIQYLWIDALCIFQDSKKDWAKEAARMRDVYAGSAVTVVASVAPSTDYGIFHDRAVPKVNPCELPWGDSASNIFLRPRSQISPKDAYSSVLHTRGWTLQEGLLAPRTLTYSSDQLVWECSAHRLDESGHTMVLEYQYDSKDFFHSKARRDNALGAKLVYRDLWTRSYVLGVEVRNQIARLGKSQVKFWNSDGLTSYGEVLKDDFLGINPFYRWGEIVLEFSKRSLTNDMDILPALSGIAQEFALLTRDTYCVGMWKSEILSSLSWTRAPVFTEKEIRKQSRYKYDLRKVSQYRAPSWSWASTNGGAVNMFPGFGEIALQNMAAITEVHIEPAGPDPFGQVKTAYLKIKAPIFELGDLWKGYWKNIADFQDEYNEIPSKLDPQIDVTYPHLHAYAQTRINSLIGAFEFEQQHMSHLNQEFALLMLLQDEGLEDGVIKGEASFLILETTGNGKNEYRRVGHLTVGREQVMMTVDADLEASKGRKKEEVYAESMKRIAETRPGELVSVGAWFEISLRSPKARTIRVV